MSKSEWSGRKVTTARAKLAATLPAPCYRCGVTIPSASDCKELGIKWDVEHTVSRVEGGSDDISSLSVSHSSCNRSHGGKLGHARTKQTKIVRAQEAERTTKFWFVGNLQNIIQFSRDFLKVLGRSPYIFVSEVSTWWNS
jgi:hypothetical protein